MKVLEGRPWCFDNMLVLLKEADGDEPPDQVTLHQSPFWIRLKNLPFNMRSNEVVKALIGNMGEILELEEDILGFGRFRRVKVMLDTRKPLRRFRKIKDRKGSEIQIDFAYERLPYFCLACGIMGHSEKDCQLVNEEDKCERLGWHLGLKATPRKGRTKEVEEEAKFKNCKKVLFEAGVCSKEEPQTNNAQLLINGADNPTDFNNKPLSSLVEKVPPTNNALIDVSITEEQHPIQVVLINEPIKAAVTDFVSASVQQSTNVVPENLSSLGTCDGQVFDTSNNTFVFSSFKGQKVNKGQQVNKGHSWKRLARGAMEDKGDLQQMEIDSLITGTKRQLEQEGLVYGAPDEATKRVKQSSSDDSSSIFLAEIGVDQSRLAL